MLLQSDIQLNQKSYYEASAQRSLDLPTLQGDVHVDVVVVGAGFAGLSAAIELAQRGYSVAVLEADRVCSGASGRNGGQAIVGFASGQEPFEQQLGKADARFAWDMSLEAIGIIDQRTAQYGIECDWTKGYLYVADSPRKARELKRSMQEQKDNYGLECDFVEGVDSQRYVNSEHYCAVAYESVSGHLHPLKYGLGLARAARTLGVQIFEHSPVVDMKRGARIQAHTAGGVVHANFGVLAGNCTLGEYGSRVAPEIKPRIMPVGTYIVATAALEPELCKSLIPDNAAVCDNNFILDYFRFSADHRMLFGGKVSYSTKTPSNLEQVMAQRMRQVFPQLQSAKIDYVWGGFVDISMNRAPDFGRLADNLYYLQGFSGHGVALTGMAGRLAAQAIAGQAERFDVFARLKHRKFPGGAMMRTPSLMLGMLFHQLRDKL